MRAERRACWNHPKAFGTARALEMIIHKAGESRPSWWAVNATAGVSSPGPSAT